MRRCTGYTHIATQVIVEIYWVNGVAKKINTVSDIVAFRKVRKHENAEIKSKFNSKSVKNYPKTLHSKGKTTRIMDFYSRKIVKN